MISNREKLIAIVNNDCLTKADAIILLEGDGFNRYKKAVELYKNGFAPKIVFSGNIIDKGYGSYPFDEIKPLLIHDGVSEKDLIYENKSVNTYEQALEIIKLSKEKNWKKIILVASHEHQYRAYLTFLRQIIDSKSKIVLYNAPARDLKWFVDDGWGIRIDRLENEFNRIEKYLALGHLANFDEAIEYQKWKESIS